MLEDMFRRDFMDSVFSFLWELFAVEFINGVPNPSPLILPMESGVPRLRIFRSSYSFRSLEMVSSLPRLGGRLELLLSLPPLLMGLANVIGALLLFVGGPGFLPRLERFILSYMLGGGINSDSSL